jgi:hypothetical protein
VDAVGKVTAVQGANTYTVQTGQSVELLNNRPGWVSIEPFNKVDFAQNAVLDGDGMAVPMPLRFAALEDDWSLTASYTWVGHDNVLVGSAITAQQALSSGTSWRNANLTDGRLTYRDGRNGWTSNIVGEYPTGTNVPIITFDARKGNAFTFNRVQLYPRTDALTLAGGAAGFPRDFTIEVSEDGGSWPTGASVTDAEAAVLSP